MIIPLVLLSNITYILLGDHSLKKVAITLFLLLFGMTMAYAQTSDYQSGYNDGFTAGVNSCTEEPPLPDPASPCEAVINDGTILGFAADGQEVKIPRKWHTEIDRVATQSGYQLSLYKWNGSENPFAIVQGSLDLDPNTQVKKVKCEAIVTPDPDPQPQPTPADFSPGTTWQWQLQGNTNTSVNAQVYDIDGFDVSKAIVDSLHSHSRKVICYFSAGSWENWRPDAGDFPDSVKGKSNGWAGEKWLDIRKIDILLPIMEKRMDMCKAKGFDAVEPDNIDGYSNNTGFSLSGQDQINYNKALAEAAHARGLAIGLKNDIEQAVTLEPFFDFAINEQCFQYDECDNLLKFINNGKAVFQAEYSLNLNQFCPQANAWNFSSIKKNEDLGVYRESCSDF